MKRLLMFAMSYSILIAITIGLRLLHNQPISATYYITITAVVTTLFLVINFTKARNIEKILPKNSKLAFILVLSRRFLPLAVQKVGKIKDNQRMRGAKFRGLAQFKSYLSLFIPGIVSSLRWAENVAEGIKMRGGE